MFVRVRYAPTRRLGKARPQKHNRDLVERAMSLIRPELKGVFPNLGSFAVAPRTLLVTAVQMRK
jgi:hypothetical protein